MKLDRAAISEILLHRHENLLLDEAVVSEVDGKRQAEFSVTISDKDELNRQYFMKRTGAGSVLLEPVYMEMLALGSIIAMGKQPEGTVAFFSAISGFLKEGNLPLGNTINGTIILKRAKGGFFSFSGELADSNGNRAASGSLMAFAMYPGMQAGQDAKKVSELPVLTIDENIDKSEITWKDSSLLFADKIRNISETQIVTEYTYPSGHPLTKGHFPGNPIMMGVTQWMAISDAILVFAGKHALAAPAVLTASGEIVKTDGTTVAEVDGCKCQLEEDGNISLLETRKIAFRDMVRPGDTFFTKISLEK